MLTLSEGRSSAPRRTMESACEKSNLSRIPATDSASSSAATPSSLSSTAEAMPSTVARRAIPQTHRTARDMVNSIMS